MMKRLGVVAARFLPPGFRGGWRSDVIPKCCVGLGFRVEDGRSGSSRWLQAESFEGSFDNSLTVHAQTS